MNFIKNIKNNIKSKFSYDELYSLRFVKIYFWHINWLKTIWFNFKALPFKQAIKLPIVISYNVKINRVGNIQLTDSVHLGMVSIGVIRIPDYESNCLPIYFTNRGTFKIKGNLKIHPGVKMYIAPKACLSVGKRVIFGFYTKVFCYKSITIGDDFRMSWEGQMFDTDFHFLYNIEKDKYYQRIKPIVIGDSVFVGNRCTIGKGTVIPNGSVVSCVSKVSGDYSEHGDNLLISGNPATLIKKHITMGNSWFPDEEQRIAKLFNE